MMRSLLNLIATIFLVIAVTTIGIFIVRSLFSIIEMRDVNIPLFDILKVSVKAGTAGGLVGGGGIYFIHYFSKKIWTNSTSLNVLGSRAGSVLSVLIKNKFFGASAGTNL
ncbi:TPA: hypothetical protein ACR8UQ_002453 [Klebsiella variicola]|uniref:hypothetical protein n=1 Tax=Klebsiella variicola TaxID=244366 RepID=UPI001159BEA7|nr:hypothetical protein [Klebsiella variicola]